MVLKIQAKDKKKTLLVVKVSNYHFMGKTAGAAVSICAAHFGFHANEGWVVFSSTSADGGKMNYQKSALTEGKKTLKSSSSKLPPSVSDPCKHLSVNDWMQALDLYTHDRTGLAVIRMALHSTCFL